MITLKHLCISEDIHMCVYVIMHVVTYVEIEKLHGYMVINRRVEDKQVETGKVLSIAT